MKLAIGKVRHDKHCLYNSHRYWASIPGFNQPLERIEMRNLIVVALATLFAANTAFAASCADQAAEKKLAGAAKNSFMKKCEKDAAATAAPTAAPASAVAPAQATPSCEEKAVSKSGKPLAGAAKNAFMKKCEADTAVAK
jgi:hypothetical protein